MEDDEEFLSNVNKPSRDVSKESKVEEGIDNEVEMTKVEECEVVNNLDGEEPKMVGEENVAVTPEAEAEVEGGGDAGGSREAVVVEEVSAVELKAEVENDAAAEVEGGGGGGDECIGETGECSGVVVVEELKVEAEVEAAAVGSEEKLALDECSEALGPKEDILAVEVAKSGGEKTVSDRNDEQTNFAEAVITSESHGEIVEEGRLGDGEKDVSDKGITQLNAESVVVAKGVQMVVAEEEKSEVATTEVAESKFENADVKVHESAVVEKDDNIVVAQLIENGTEGVVEVATENEENLPPKLEGSETVASESGVAIRQDKMDEEMTEVIPMAEAKMEMEIDAGPKLSMDKGGEGEPVCESHGSGVDGETPVVAKEEKDELKGLAEDESLADNAQMEKEKQLDIEGLDVAKDEKDEVKENGLLQRENDEVRGITQENSSVTGNKLESEEGRETELNKTKYGKLVDSQSNSVDKNGEDEEIEAKEDIGTKGTKIDAETENEVENMEITNDGEDEEAEAEEEIGAEDTIMDGETETELENMQITNDGEGEATDQLDGPKTPQDEEDEAMVAEEETTAVDTEVETETDVAESGIAAGGKRKRGKSKNPANSKVTAKANKTMEEDVCFICFDGGELVLCDRR